MITKKRVAAVLLSFAVAAGTSVLAAGEASASTLHCTTTTGNTGGSATCTGAGTWRIRLDCAGEPDTVGRYITQKSGTTRQTAECTFDNRHTTVEIR